MATRVLRSIVSRLPDRRKGSSGYAGTRTASAVGPDRLIPMTALCPGHVLPLAWPGR